MSAVRMVAYGVLELKHKEASPFRFLEAESAAHLEEMREDDRQRDELRKLVSDELKRYGLLITRMVVPKGKAWRIKANDHVLYGQTKGAKGFSAREILHEGSFKECCIEAAKLLDALDQSQLPDTATGF